MGLEVKFLGKKAINTVKESEFDLARRCLEHQFWLESNLTKVKLAFSLVEDEENVDNW